MEGARKMRQVSQIITGVCSFALPCSFDRLLSEKPFREIVSFLDGAPRRHVQTLTWRTKKGVGGMQMRQIGQMQIDEYVCIRI